MYYLGKENKGAVQLRGYGAADLCLCFRICKQRQQHILAQNLPEQLELSQIVRKRKLFRRFSRMNFKQVIIHLSKLLNSVFLKCF